MTWEERLPTNKKKGPYEFLSKEHTDEYEDLMSLFTPGKYVIVHNGYKYWVMRGGIGRRKIPLPVPKAETIKPPQKEEAESEHHWTWTEEEENHICNSCWNCTRTQKLFGYDGRLIRFFCGHRPYKLTYMKIIRKRKGVQLETSYITECERHDTADGLVEACKQWERRQRQKIREERMAGRRMSKEKIEENRKKYWSEGKDIDYVISHGKVSS
jgi:hypothetical protein